jgi:hypothetical protein
VRYVLAVFTPARKQPLDEEVPELPPLDGGDDETENPTPDLEDAELPTDTDDPFDDRAGDPAQGDGSAEIELAGEEGGWLADADEAEGLDVGDAELLTEQQDLLHDNEESDSLEEVEDLGHNDPSTSTDADAGEEGPSDDDEELREEDLPRLDADEGGAPDDEDFIDEDFGADEAAPLGVPWHTERWERVGAPLAVGPVRALACVARGVLAGGSGLCRLDLEGGVEKVRATGLDGGDVTSVWASGSVVVVTTEDGGLFVSHDQAESFARAAAWRDLVRPDEAAAGIDVVLGAGELWVRTALGTLLWSGDLGASFDTVDLGGFVGAVGIDDSGDLAAVVRTLRGGELARGRRASLVHIQPPGSLSATELAGRVQLAAEGPNVALAPEGRAASVSLDGGASWTSVPGTVTATALAWSKGEGCLVVGLHDERHERTFLARVSSRGESRLVAEIMGAPDAEGGILTVVCDAARGVVWVGGAFGVAAFQPSAKSL